MAFLALNHCGIHIGAGSCLDVPSHDCFTIRCGISRWPPFENGVVGYKGALLLDWDVPSSELRGRETRKHARTSVKGIQNVLTKARRMDSKPQSCRAAETFLR